MFLNKGLKELNYNIIGKNIENDIDDIIERNKDLCGIEHADLGTQEIKMYNNRCIGVNCVMNSHKTMWYGLIDVPITKITICGFCNYTFSKLKLHQERLYELKNITGRIECDSIKDYVISGMEYKSASVQVLLGHNSPCLVKPAFSLLRKQGIFVVNVPTSGSINIRLKDLASHHSYYFTYTLAIMYYDHLKNVYEREIDAESPYKSEGAIINLYSVSQKLLQKNTDILFEKNTSIIIRIKKFKKILGVIKFGDSEYKLIDEFDMIVKLFLNTKNNNHLFKYNLRSEKYNLDEDSARRLCDEIDDITRLFILSKKLNKFQYLEKYFNLLMSNKLIEYNPLFESVHPIPPQEYEPDANREIIFPKKNVEEEKPSIIINNKINSYINEQFDDIINANKTKDGNEKKADNFEDIDISSTSDKKNCPEIISFVDSENNSSDDSEEDHFVKIYDTEKNTINEYFNIK